MGCGPVRTALVQVFAVHIEDSARFAVVDDDEDNELDVGDNNDEGFWTPQ